MSLIKEPNCEAREKYWEELGVYERVERMRVIVKRLLRQNQELRDKVQTLGQHRHDADGRLMIPYNCNGGPCGPFGGFRYDGDKYF